MLIANRKKRLNLSLELVDLLLIASRKGLKFIGVGVLEISH